MQLRCSVLLLAALGIGPAGSAKAQTVTFDFDTGVPAIATGRSTPLDQTSGGFTAHFSSPSGPAFSIQSDSTTGWRLSQFSGNYLYANNQNGNALDIQFSQPLTGITLTFATADFQQVEVPTTIQLTAYLDSTATPAIGSATAHGKYASDTMPMGKLSFDSGDKPFNLVEIVIPRQARAAGAFFVDNVIVTPAVVTPALASVSAATYVSGAPLAAGSIAIALGQNLASGAEAATEQPPPATLADTMLQVRDSAGVERQALLYSVDPAQVKFVVPDGTALGPATVSVISAGQLAASGTVNIDLVAPGLFTANSDGAGPPLGAALVTAPDQTQSTQALASCGEAQGSCVASPIDLGPDGTQVVLVLYGTGIRGRSSLAGVTAKIGGVDAEVQLADADAQWAGLDQVNVVIPGALAGQGEVDLSLTVDGRTANLVRVNIK